MASHPRRQAQSRPTRPGGPWLHGSIPVVGLIGAIGAGKSAVASLLAERGAFVLDADAVGHALLDQKPVRDQVIARFGPRILAASSEPDAPPAIDRRALGAIVFASPAQLKGLEAILHPRMRRTFERAIARVVRKEQARSIVLDAAILLEAGWDSLCDVVLYVDAPREPRLARLKAQRGWDEVVLDSREAAQWSPERKRQAAAAVINNDSDLEALRTEVDRVWTKAIVPPRGARPARATRSGREVIHRSRRG